MKEDLRGKFIMTKGVDHAKKVKKFFSSRGVDTDAWTFDGSIAYYGVRPDGGFDSYNVGDLPHDCTEIQLPEDELPIPRMVLAWDHDDDVAIKSTLVSVMPRNHAGFKYIITLSTVEDVKAGKDFDWCCHKQIKELPTVIDINKDEAFEVLKEHFGCDIRIIEK